MTSNPEKIQVFVRIRPARQVYVSQYHRPTVINVYEYKNINYHVLVNKILWGKPDQALHLRLTTSFSTQ